MQQLGVCQVDREVWNRVMPYHQLDDLTMFLLSTVVHDVLGTLELKYHKTTTAVVRIPTTGKYVKGALYRVHVHSHILHN